MNMSVFNFHKMTNMHKCYACQFFDFIIYKRNYNKNK
jgi:hypothetical protein